MKLYEYRILKDWRGFYIQKRLPGDLFWSRVKDYCSGWDGTYGYTVNYDNVDAAQVRVVKEIYSAIQGYKLSLEKKKRRTILYSWGVNIEAHLDDSLEYLAAHLGVDPDLLNDDKASAEQEAEADMATAQGDIPS